MAYLEHALHFYSLSPVFSALPLSFSPGEKPAPPPQREREIDAEAGETWYRVGCAQHGPRPDLLPARRVPGCWGRTEGGSVG